MKFTKTLCLAAMLCCVPASVIMTGCGGGNGLSVPTGTVPTQAEIIGSYAGVATQTSGDSDSGKGETDNFSFTIATDGKVTIKTSDNRTLIGAINFSDGKFSATFSDSQAQVTTDGYIRKNNGQIVGAGNYNDKEKDDDDSSSGTIALSKVLD